MPHDAAALLSLADRVEGSDKSSTDLDAEIALALEPESRGWRPIYGYPRYTGSVDIAATLMGGVGFWSVASTCGALVSFPPPNHEIEARAVTPALALCAAALRALAAKE